MGSGNTRRPHFLLGKSQVGIILRFIAHRGNLEGPGLQENSPTQIDVCISQSIECEVDLWVEGQSYLLGHDFGQYQVTLEWLLDRKLWLWIHCKNPEALERLSEFGDSSLNYFWHEGDAYTITSSQRVWVYPGKRVLPNSIAVLPEIWFTEDRREEISSCFAMCTDYVIRYQAKFEDSRL